MRTEKHHQVPLLDYPTLAEKLRAVDWHLRNLWTLGWSCVVELEIEKHRIIHGKRV